MDLYFKSILLNIILLLSVCILNSCSKEEEEWPTNWGWEAMKWQVDNIEGNVEVETNGNALMNFYISGEGYVDITCLNYHPWISPGTYYPDESDDWSFYQYEWLTVKVEGETVHCEFKNPPEDFHKEINVTMTAGDIFFTFIFYREEDFGPSGKWAPINFEIMDLQGDMEIEQNDYSTIFYVDGNCSVNLVCTNYEDIWFLPSYFNPDPIECLYNVWYNWCQLYIQGNIIHCDVDKWYGGDNWGCDFKVSAGEITNQLYFYQNSAINR